jgi:CBS domain-containing protein
MKARDVMTRSIVKIGREAGFERARSLMAYHGIHHLLVYDGQRLVGILSARDLERTPGRGSKLTVGDVMTSRVIKAPVDAPLRRLANLIRGHAIGCLVVTDRRRPVGVITTADLLDAMGGGVVIPSTRQARPPLRYRTPHRHKSIATGMW